MNVRRKPDGRWFFRVWVRCPDGVRRRVFGTPREFGLSNTEAATKKAMALKLAAILQGQPVTAEKPSKAPTVKAFAPVFMAAAGLANKSSTVGDKETILELHILPRLGHLPLDQVTYAVVEDLKVALSKTPTANVSRRKDGKPGTAKEIRFLSAKTINNVLTVLKRMLNIAKDREVIDKAPRIEWLKVPPAPIDFFDYAEADRLVCGVEGEDRAMIMVALRTGLRLGELMALRWSDVDLVAGRLTVRKSIVRGVVGVPKSHKDRTIPLSGDAVAAFKSQRHLRGPLVFCNMKGGYLRVPKTRYLMERACKKAGLRAVGWHVLRHTFASHLAMRGVPLLAIQEYMGHATIGMTMRYAHLAPDVGRAAVMLLDRGAQPVPETAVAEPRRAERS